MTQTEKKKVLFINACIRSRGISRTWELCDAFVAEYKKQHPDAQLEEIYLSKLSLHCYLEEDIMKRNDLLAAGRYEDEMFALARQFAEANEIIIGAPYWDMSFPAVLKVYIETICVEGITFQTTEKGLKGLAKFEKMTYLSTCGGYTTDGNRGVEYMKTIAAFLGNGVYQSVTAEGLDIAGNDVKAILDDAKARAKKLVK